jgi:hypothetical protein
VNEKLVQPHQSVECSPLRLDVFARCLMISRSNSTTPARMCISSRLAGLDASLSGETILGWWRV